MSWIYKKSHGQEISSSISSLLLPTAPYPVWGNSLLPLGCLQTPCSVSPLLARAGQKWYLSTQKEQAVEEQSSSPRGAHQNNAEHGWGEMDGWWKMSLRLHVGSL